MRNHHIPFDRDQPIHFVSFYQKLSRQYCTRLLVSLCLLFQSLFAFELLAQDVKLFKRFGVDNHLSYQFVRTIAQDAEGFMWFGSHEGLHRFDGHQFISYYHDAKVTNSLSSDVISRILFDQQNRLWVGTTGGGLNLFRAPTQDFLHFSNVAPNLKLSNDVINAIFQDSKGKIWVGTEHGINIISEKEDGWQVQTIVQQLGNTHSLTHNTVHDIIETKHQEVWVATNGGGISVFDLAGNFLRAIKIGDTGASLYTNKFINSLHYDGNETVWMGTTENGLLKYNIRSKHVRHFIATDDNKLLISNTIKTIYRRHSSNNNTIDANSNHRNVTTENNELWIATDKGLMVYNEQSERFSHFQHTANNPYSLSNDFILSFYQDSKGLMWIGTLSGVNRWDPSMSTFEQFSSRTHTHLENNNITNFAQRNNDHIIFSTYSGGLYQLDLHSEAIESLALGEPISRARIMSLYMEQAKQILWVGTRTSGLFKIHLPTKTVDHFQHDENNEHSISANSITDIVRDERGRLWVSTFHQGLNLLIEPNSTNNSVTQFVRFVANKHQPQLGPSTNQILQLLPDSSGDLWVATYGGGLNRFNFSTKEFVHIHFDKTKPDSISSDIAWIMLEDSAQNLWVGTQAAGLNQLSAKNKRAGVYNFEHFDTKDGMRSRTVYGLSEDEFGDIWFSTNKGISRFSPNLREFKHFDLAHGLVDYEYNHNAFFSDNAGHIYFGSGNGFNRVMPSRLVAQQVAPEVRLTNILKLNETVPLPQSLSSTKYLNLDYQDQLVSFDYVGLNFSNPGTTRYRYRLLGFEEQWIEAGNLRRATYTNLPQGQFQLQIAAASGDGEWGEPLTLNVNMEPAPWNTWWAYILYATLVAICLLVYSRLLNRKLANEQQQKAILEQQVKEKTQEFVKQNHALETANRQLEQAATIDKVTGVKSRRYLDIYIEQASQLMSQIHQNLLPVQRDLLPRLYLLMVKVPQAAQESNSQLINITDLLLYSRNNDDIVIRWSEDTFAVIGFEKGNNVADLAARLDNRFPSVLELKDSQQVQMTYSFYPFNREQPMELSWDQVSVLIEKALEIKAKEHNSAWLGLTQPKMQPFDYISVLQAETMEQLKHYVVITQNRV